jgi:hypothetical protein
MGSVVERQHKLMVWGPSQTEDIWRSAAGDMARASDQGHKNWVLRGSYMSKTRTFP